jgi:hypothetical protein
MSAEEDIARLRQDVEAARRRHDSASAAAGQAEARASATREDLQAEFGVASVTEVRAVLADLDAQVEAEVAEVRRQLALAGGSQ